MEVRSNRIGDIRSHYRRKLCDVYEEKEADNLLFMVIMEYTGLSKAAVLTNHEQAVSESELLKIHFAVKDLLKEKPIQYILGKTEFYGLPFLVNSKVLIPRPETEELVEAILQQYKNTQRVSILDIGTGSGCIPITIKKYIPIAEVSSIDVSSFALEVAQENAKLNNVEIDFRVFDILDRDSWQNLKMFDVIVSNPPYVRNLEKVKMKKNVLEYEPKMALFVEDSNPLIFYKSIAEFGQKHLYPGGKIYCEINQYLAEETKELFEQNKYVNVQIFKDMLENARIIYCEK
jgi:release factor glutamine methyltransferase